MNALERVHRSDPESFIGIVDTLLSHGGFVVQIVHAFFDESGSHDGSPVLCVAGYAFQKREARLLAREWDTILMQNDLPFFRMVECAHGNDNFEHFDKPQRIKIQTSLIGIIKRRAAHGFAVSVDTKAFAELMPAGDRRTVLMRSAPDVSSTK
jgi:hypothetical protein